MSMHAEAPAAPGLVVREADGVPVLELPADLEFEALRDWLDAQLPGAAEAIGGRSGRLDLGDRILQLFDLRRLLHHLEDAHDLQITGLYSTADAVHAFAQKELKLRLFVVDPTALDLPDRPDEPAPDELVSETPQVDQAPPLELDPDTLVEADKVEPTEPDDTEEVPR